METTEIFDKHVKKYEKWFDDHRMAYQSEVLALKEHFSELPENIRGIEVGLGTGRFSEPLGIKEGIEPSVEMAEKAIKRGIEIMKGTAERLPYSALQFDFVLFVTICYFKNVKKAFQEAHRVLKPKGSVIIGFLDSEQSVAKSYMEKKQKSNFYKEARFYSANHVKNLLEKTGFEKLVFSQTLFGELDDINEIQRPKPGFGEGSFVVVKATKK